MARDLDFLHKDITMDAGERAICAIRVSHLLQEIKATGYETSGFDIQYFPDTGIDNPRQRINRFHPSVEDQNGRNWQFCAIPDGEATAIGIAYGNAVVPIFSLLTKESSDPTQRNCVTLMPIPRLIDDGATKTVDDWLENMVTTNDDERKPLYELEDGAVVPSAQIVESILHLVGRPSALEDHPEGYVLTAPQLFGVLNLQHYIDVTGLTEEIIKSEESVALSKTEKLEPVEEALSVASAIVEAERKLTEQAEPKGWVIKSSLGERGRRLESTAVTTLNFVPGEGLAITTTVSPKHSDKYSYGVATIRDGKVVYLDNRREVSEEQIKRLQLEVAERIGAQTKVVLPKPTEREYNGEESLNAEVEKANVVDYSEADITQGKQLLVDRLELLAASSGRGSNWQRAVQVSEEIDQFIRGFELLPNTLFDLNGCDSEKMKSSVLLESLLQEYPPRHRFTGTFNLEESSLIYDLNYALSADIALVETETARFGFMPNFATLHLLNAGAQKVQATNKKNENRLLVIANDGRAAARKGGPVILYTEENNRLYNIHDGVDEIRFYWVRGKNSGFNPRSVGNLPGNTIAHFVKTESNGKNARVMAINGQTVRIEDSSYDEKKRKLVKDRSSRKRKKALVSETDKIIDDMREVCSRVGINFGYISAEYATELPHTYTKTGLNKRAIGELVKYATMFGGGGAGVTAAAHLAVESPFLNPVIAGLFGGGVALKKSRILKRSIDAFRAKKALKTADSDK
jgi:hypothetical protein